MHYVALRKESVDRNSIASASIRACITVALRKESVDRNIPSNGTLRNTHKSLSARRAWIEIDWASVISAMTSQVALRKESVDRNPIISTITLIKYGGRSPQGERG